METLGGVRKEYPEAEASSSVPSQEDMNSIQSLSARTIVFCKTLSGKTFSGKTSSSKTSSSKTPSRKHLPAKHLPAKHPPQLPITGMAGSRIAEAGAVNSTTPSTDIGLLGAHNGPRRGGCFAGKSNARQAIITGHGREGSSLKKCQANLSFWKIYLTLLSRFNARRNRAALDDSPQPHLTAVPGTT